MNYGLSAYETKKLETPAVPKMSASVIDGVYDWTKQTKSQVKLICPDAPDKYQVLVKDGEKIEIQIRARKELASPVLEDEVCGEVSFWLSEVCLGTYPIYPEQAVVEAKALDTEMIRSQLQEFLDEYNKNQPTYRRITGLVIRKNPFIRNTTKKIRRQDVLIDEPQA